MPLLAGECSMSLTPSRFPCLRAVALVLLAVTGGSLAGCDRQKAAPPQAPPGSDAATKSGLPRYRIDASGAGTPLSTAAVKGPDDDPAALASLSGKPVLVNLWATWCAPCIEELPTLNRLASEVGDTGHVITLSQDLTEDAGPLRAFLTTRGWSAVTPWHDPENSVGLAYGGSLPTTILFDASGKEVVRVVGPMDWYGKEAKALLRQAGFAV
jgi:thiol-disulfide isomerase/thioredoxin